jgi:hypothetical protein
MGAHPTVVTKRLANGSGFIRSEFFAHGESHNVAYFPTA